MKTKLTFSELNTFKNMIPVSRDELNEFVGGGDGSGIRNAYSLSEYINIGDSFIKGWVRFDDDDVRYLTQNYNTYCGGSNDYSGSDYSGTSSYGGSSDYLGTSSYGGSTDYWGASSYGGSSDYSGTSSYDGSPGYWGAFSYYSDLDDKYIELSNLINQLPSSIREALRYVDIEYNPGLETAGRYYAVTNTIVLSELTYTALYRECIHVIQNEYHLGGAIHAAKEFQEAVLGDLMVVKDERSGGYKCANDQEYGQWLQNCIDINGEIDVSKFINGVEYYFQEFLKKYPNISGYQGSVPSGYNFNWTEMMWRLGLIDTNTPWK